MSYARQAVTRLTLNMALPDVQASFSCTVGDVNRRLEVTLHDHGEPFALPPDWTAFLAGIKPDGTRLANSCVVDNGKIIYDFAGGGEIATSPGIFAVVFEVYDELGELVASPKVWVHVADNMGMRIVNSADQFTILSELIGKINGAQADADELKVKVDELMEKVTAGGTVTIPVSEWTDNLPAMASVSVSGVDNGSVVLLLPADEATRLTAVNARLSAYPVAFTPVDGTSTVAIFRAEADSVPDKDMTFAYLVLKTGITDKSPLAAIIGVDAFGEGGGGGGSVIDPESVNQAQAAAAAAQAFAEAAQTARDEAESAAERAETAADRAESAGGSGGENYAVPAYIVSEAERVAKNVQTARTAKTFVMVCGTDMHLKDGDTAGNHPLSLVSAQYAGLGIKEIKKRTHLDLVALLGDYSFMNANDYTAEQTMKDIVLAKKTLDLGEGEAVWSVGNHDWCYGSGTDRLLTEDEIYGYICANSDGVKPYTDIERGYGYIDFDHYKIRVVNLNTCDCKDGKDNGTNYQDSSNYARLEFVSPTQMRWLADVALDFTDKGKGWGVVFVSHHPVDYGNAWFADLLRVLEAYRDGGTVTLDLYKYHDGTAWVKQTETFDFSGMTPAEIICNVHGHSHNCGSAKVSSSTCTTNATTGVAPWLWRFCVPNMCVGRENEKWSTIHGEVDESGNAIYHTKEAGTAKATAFNVVSIDRKKQKIYAHIFGAGRDRVMSYGEQENVMYSVTNTLTNCSSSNSNTEVENGMSYTATIIANTGYELSSVTVTMGGVDVTATAYDNGAVSIASVTGDIVITATATIKTYSVTKNLTACSISNSASTVNHGSPYSATITANEGYILDSVSVTMGGEAVTATDGLISIASVTGDIVITATAIVEKIKYTVSVVKPDNVYQAYGLSSSYDEGTYVRETFYKQSGKNFKIKVLMAGTDITNSACTLKSGTSLEDADSVDMFFYITGNVLITITSVDEVEPVIYTVTKNVTNCSVSNSAEQAIEGSSYTATIMANSGYTLDSVIVTMGGEAVTVTDGVINIESVTGDIVITATATLNTYSVTKNLTACSISNSASTVNHGSPYSATITANEGYTLDSVSVTMGGEAVTVTDGVINIESVTGDIVITATATIKTYSVTKTLTSCSISNSASSVNHGSAYSATITANEGYTLDSVSVTMGGEAVTVTDGVINIESVTGNIVITATAIVEETEPANLLDMSVRTLYTGYTTTYIEDTDPHEMDYTKCYATYSNNRRGQYPTDKFSEFTALENNGFSANCSSGSGYRLEFPVNTEGGKTYSFNVTSEASHGIQLYKYNADTTFNSASQLLATGTGTRSATFTAESGYLYSIVFPFGSGTRQYTNLSLTEKS